jgi:hypothetical protein
VAELLKLAEMLYADQDQPAIEGGDADEDWLTEKAWQKIGADEDVEASAGTMGN